MKDESFQYQEKEFLNILFNELNINHIRYMVLRNFSCLPDSLDGSDLDIWVHEDDSILFRNILKDKVLPCFNGKIVMDYGRKCERLCIIYGGNGVYNGIQIDLHVGCFQHNGKKSVNSDGVYSRHCEVNGIAVPSEDDMNIINFMKELLNNAGGGRTKKYFPAFTEALKHNNTVCMSEYEDLFDKKKWNELCDLHSLPLKEICFKKVSMSMRSGLFCGILNWYFHKWIEVIKRLPRFIHPVGFDMAIIGTDGSGKTTVINLLQTAFSGAAHNGYFYYHMFPGLFPSLSQLLKKEKKGPFVPVTDPHGGKQSGFIGSLVRICYYSLDYTIGYWVKVYLCRVKKASIHVFDRYYYDYLLDQKRAAIKLPLWIRKLFVSIYPSPCIIFCLGANPEEIFERKKELPLPEIQRQVSALKEFQKHHKNAYWIDTGCSIEDSIDQIMNLLCFQMEKRIK